MNKQKPISDYSECTQEKLSNDGQQTDIRSLSGRLVAKYDPVYKRIHIYNHKEWIIIQVLPDQQITILH